MNFKKEVLTAVGAAAMVAASVTPAVASDSGSSVDLQSRLDDFIGLVPGGAVAVTIHDGEMATAATGIANAAGDPVELDTPFLTGGFDLPLYAALTMRLADEGLIDLDEPVETYLPDVHIDPSATVMSVLTHRAGLPNVLGTVVEMSLADPGREWTTDDYIGLVDPNDVAAAGEYNPNATTHFYTQHLIKAASGSDLSTALSSRISEPLGMDGTTYIHDASDVPDGLAAGWLLDLGLEGDATAERTAFLSGETATTAEDLATFMSALFDGEIVSEGLLPALFDEDHDIWDGHDDAFGGLGDLGGRYVSMYGGSPSGFNSTIAGDPVSGDVVVVLANNEGLDTLTIVRDIVREWAPPAASVAVAAGATEGSGSIEWLANATCEYGQRSERDLPPCVMDEAGLHVTESNPGQRTGAFDGYQLMDGEAIVNPETGTFTYTGTVTFAGTVDGCGTGTVHLEGAGEGFIGPDGASTFTTNTSTVVPGGSLPVQGFIDEAGTEVEHGDGTATLGYTATFECDGAADA